MPRTSILSTFSALFLLVLFSYPLNAQTDLDSLRALVSQTGGEARIDIKNKIARRLLYVSHTEAEQLLEEIIRESDELNYDNGKGLAQVLRSTLYMFQSKFAEAKSAYAKSIAFAEQIGHQEALAYGKLGLGGLYINKGELALAYENHIEGVKFARAIANADLELSYLMNIGVINQLLEDYDEAEKYFTQALEIGEVNKLNHRLGQIHGNLGIIEMKRKNYGLSIDNYTKAIKYFEELNANTQSAISYQNIGFSYAKLRNYGEAEKAYDKSLELRLLSGDSLGYARGLRYKGELYMESNELLRAQNFFSRALPITKKYNNKVLLSEIYELQFKTYEKQSNFRMALEAHKNFMSSKDTLTAKANRNKIAELTAEFEFEKLENENKLRSSENEIKDLKIGQRNQQLSGVIVLLVLVVFWALWKRKQLRNRLVIKEKDHQIAQKEVQLRASEFEAEKMQLVHYANQLLSKNEELEVTRVLLESKITDGTEEREEIDSLIEKLRSTINEKKDWTVFRLYFDSLFPNYFDRLVEYGGFELTMYEQRLIALVKITLSNKEIGGILNISRNSVVRAKHRLRQKFGFEENKVFEDFLQKP